MSEEKYRYCDNDKCEMSLQLEPVAYGNVMSLDWLTLTRGNGETHHFCSIECAKAWIKVHATPIDSAKDSQNKPK